MILQLTPVLYRLLFSLEDLIALWVFPFETFSDSIVTVAIRVLLGSIFHISNHNWIFFI